MLGGVLSGLGMAASSFTQSISQLYITAGVVTGQQTIDSFIITSWRLITVVTHDATATLPVQLTAGVVTLQRANKQNLGMRDINLADNVFTWHDVW